MKRLQRKNHKKTKTRRKKHLGFLEALRLYAGMPVEI